MPIRWKEFVFPALVGAWVLLYWLQLEDAPPAARRVPDGVMVLLGILCAMIVVRDGSWRQSRAADEPGSADPASGAGAGLLSYWREGAYVLLSILYFLLFAYLGFHVANVTFLALALLVSGNSLRTVIVATTATALVIFAAAQLMQFNLPTPILFR